MAAARHKAHIFGLTVATGMLVIASCSSASDQDSAAPQTTTPTATAPPGSPTTPDAPTAPATSAPVTSSTVPELGPPPLPDLDAGPVMMFGAMPPKPATVDYVIPIGSADYFDLFESDAPWAEAADRVQIFRLHAFQVRHYLSDEQLITIFDWLDEHRIPLLFETEPLQPPDPAECDHAESFEGPYDLEMAQRIKDLGGTIAVVAIEQPFTAAYQLEGPRVCHYSLERIVGEVMDYMTEMRRIFPGVPIGSIEGLLVNPATTPEDMALWLDTYEAIAGEPFAFLHIDVDWNRPDWPEVLRGIEAVADERDVPFGILYNGGQETTSSAWLQAAAEFIAEYEVSTGGTPEHISFQTWVDQPDHVLPEDDPGAFTSLINRYFGVRTVLDSIEVVPASGESPTQLGGRLSDQAGVGVGGQEIAAGVIALDGAVGTASVSGVVPDGATVALIAARVNAENATPGNTDARIYDLRYTEGGAATNLVPNGNMGRGAESWGFYGEPFGDARFIRSDQNLAVGSDQMMSLVADPGQVIYLDGEPFPVTPGAEFDFSATFGFDPIADGTAVVSVIFLEVDARTNIRVEPVSRPLPPVTTSADGSFAFDLPTLTGEFRIDITALGDLDTWPALLSTTLDAAPAG